MTRQVMRGFHPPATRQPLEIGSGRVDDETNKFLAFSGYVRYHSFHICDRERYRVESSQSQNLSQHWTTKSFSASLWRSSLGVESVSSYHVTDLQRDWQGAFCFHHEETRFRYGKLSMSGWKNAIHNASSLLFSTYHKLLSTSLMVGLNTQPSKSVKASSLFSTLRTSKSWALLKLNFRDILGRWK